MAIGNKQKDSRIFGFLPPSKGSGGRISWLLLLAVSAIIFTRCANESVPQGGAQDKEPPKASKINPPDKSLHFSTDKIEIKFNEFLKSTGFAQTLISPPMDKRPEFKIAGKTLTVKLKGPLRPNTTYTINFADDIQDLNEGNIVNNFSYVFSTGDFIDSQSVSGNVLIARDNTAAEEVIVSLYPKDSADGILYSKPFYFAKTDKSGYFQINNIKAGEYLIYALKDQNYNYLYDQPNELIAFSDSVLSLKDSLKPQVKLYLFEETKGKIKLDEVRSIAPGFIQIYYTKPINDFKLSGNLYSEGDFAQFYDTYDTINYWYSKYYVKRDTLFLTANDSIFDTARLDLKFIEKDSLPENAKNSLTIVNQANTDKENTESKEVWNVQDLYKPLKISFTRPITEINEHKVLQITDSSGKVVESKFSLDAKTKQSVAISFTKQENMIYSIAIPDSAFKDILGTFNKNIIYKFRTNAKDAYGNLRITLKTDHPENYYIVRLLNANNETVQEFLFTGNGERKVSVENIPAGSYKFLVIDDENRNGKWDTGNFRKKLQPEKMFIYKDTYQLKGGWDLDAEVKF